MKERQWLPDSIEMVLMTLPQKLIANSHNKMTGNAFTSPTFYGCTVPIIVGKV